MSNTNDIGISPVLLQAVSQSLSTTSERLHNPSITTKMSECGPVKSGAADERGRAQNDAGLQTDTIKAMLKIKMAANALTKSYFDGIKSEEGVVTSSTSTSSDLAMANVLTALASQGSKNLVSTVSSSPENQNSNGSVTSTLLNDSRFQTVTIGNKKVLIETKTVDKLPTDEPQMVSFPVTTGSEVTLVKPEPCFEEPVNLETQSRVTSSPTNISSNMTFTLPGSSVTADKANPAGTAILISEGSSLQPGTVLSSGDSGSGPQLVFSFNPPPPASSEAPTENQLKVIEHEGKRYIIQAQDFMSNSNTQVIGTTQVTDSAQSYTVQLNADDGVTYTSVAEQEVVTVGQQQEEGASGGGGVTVPGYKGSGGMSNTPCPVCGDHVSGFHYGIFTCESCKGFFKRTVQNKKTFVCPRSGECEIALENRKKCPACRFAKCLVMGMKLEAIRHDRQRGGRSSYGGSAMEEKKNKRPVKLLQRRPSFPNMSNESALASVLNSGAVRTEKPYVPQILTDIMNLESLLNDDDIPSSISADDFTIANPNVFLTLLQLCELKLYKIVRWARNLPYFANISTDDQILLLQNCWCDLLALTLCWKSLQLNNEIVFFHGQTIDMEKASSLELGEMFNNMLSIVEQFKRLKVDQYECVALKVIILICPDIKGLNDAEKLSEQQQRVSIALENYTSSHYRQTPNKYGEILLRLPELSRISCLLKDQLLNWMPTNTTSCGLLYELLKGENMRELA